MNIPMRPEFASRQRCPWFTRSALVPVLAIALAGPAIGTAWAADEPSLVPAFSPAAEENRGEAGALPDDFPAGGRETPPPTATPETSASSNPPGMHVVDSNSEPTPGVGYIMNLSDHDVDLQFRRRAGVLWTEPIKLHAGGRLEFRPQEAADSEIFGVTEHVNPRFVVVRYRQWGGYMQVRLSARSNSDPSILMPFHFYVVDNQGVGRMLQAPNQERARNLQRDILARPAMSPEAFAHWRRQLLMAGAWRPVPEDPAERLAEVYGQAWSGGTGRLRGPWGIDQYGVP